MNEPLIFHVYCDNVRQTSNVFDSAKRAIAFAKICAGRLKCIAEVIEVIHTEKVKTKAKIADVWPSGQVDLTWRGSELL